MFALLLMFALAIAHQPGLLKAGFHAVFSRLDRTYADSARDLYTNILLLVFRLGTLALALQTIFFHEGEFSILIFLLIVAGLMVWELIKWLSIRALASVFMTVRALEAPMAYYANLQLMASMLVYPITLVIIDYNCLIIGEILLAIVYATYLVLLSIRMVRMFLSKPIAIFYIALYIVTLEVIPVGILCYLVNLIA